MKVGIITYHAAYNYGSVFQALATQVKVNELGHEAKIINYRMPEQRNFYSLYRTKFGYKNLIKDLLQLPVHHKRGIRAKKFEFFMKEKFTLTDEFSDPRLMRDISDEFEVVISGSDQLWNKHSCEFEHNEWKYMNPYLLDGVTGKKISYASSIAQMTNEEMGYLIPYLSDFSKISMREQSSAIRMEKLLKRSVCVVSDPTFLLSKKEWTELMELKVVDHEPYVFFYSLDGINDLLKRKDHLIKFARRKKCKLKILTPYAYYPYTEKFIEQCADYGPKEFLSTLFNADYVVTDSYHGTILSVNFGRNVYSICKKGGAEFRKMDILERLGLPDKVVYDIADLNYKEFIETDFESVKNRVEGLRNASVTYLRNSIVD